MIYSSNSRIKFDFDDYYSLVEIQSAVSQFEFIGGETNTANAFNDVRNELTTGLRGNRPNIKDILIIINDGNTTDSTSALMMEVNSLKNSHGFTLMAVGIYREGEDDNTNLNAVVSNENYLFVTNRNDLHLHVLPLVEQMNSCHKEPTPIPPVQGEFYKLLYTFFISSYINFT